MNRESVIAECRRLIARYGITDVELAQLDLLPTDLPVQATAQSETPPGKGGVSVNAVKQEKSRDE